MPMAPPRLLGLGFVNSHRDGLITLAANPYAAMPSLHACDSLIVGIVLARQTQALVGEGVLDASGRPGSGSPSWRPGNHFWLDCIAGMFVALLAMAIVYERLPVVAFVRRRRPASPARHRRPEPLLRSAA